MITSVSRPTRSPVRWLYVTMVAIPVLVALLGPELAELAPDQRQAPFGPSSWSPFGTDRLGRDVLVAALQGGRTLLLTTLATVVCAYTLGLIIGMAAAATSKRWLEDALMRPVDVLLCLPSLLLIMVAALRTDGSPVAVACAVGLALIAPIARFVRMSARGVVQGPVMDALRMQGQSRFDRYVRHALRDMARPVAADLGVRVTAAVYFLSSANFLGLGFDTTSTDWAVSIAANKDGLSVAPWSVYLPAILIAGLVIGINLLWDDLLSDPYRVAERDALRTVRDD